MKTFVIALAGGKGTRMNAAVNKVLMPVCGKTVIVRSLAALTPFADDTVIVARPETEHTEEETSETTKEKTSRETTQTAKIGKKSSKKVVKKKASKVRYTEYLFVGDSRTVGLDATISGISSIARVGSGLTYLKNVMGTVVKTREKNVIFNSGVNDLANYRQYAAFYKTMPKEFIENNNVIIMSVNPTSGKKYGSWNKKIETFCFTGSGPMPRNELVEHVYNLGHKATDNANLCTVLVAEDPMGSSSKLRKARAKGIKIISYAEFMKVFNVRD